ncbi:MAG: LytTR family transcriptional regulator [Lachnospiraceae bacterium]|nr:LytTR family transcriptional regulator [Lachnospiraceae bacterium]
MNIKAIINEKYIEKELHVCSNKMDSEVTDMIASIDRLINNGFPVKAANGDTVPVYPRDIFSVYAESQKVYIRTADGTFESSRKLYELEDDLDEAQFIRISRAEIVNIKKIKRLDLGISGTIKVIMSDGSESYTSRRNVTKLKKALSMK